MSNEFPVAIARPAYLAQVSTKNDDFLAPVGGGLGVPRLSFRGGHWRILSADSEERPIMDKAGHPLTYVEVITVAANPGVYKTFFDKAYDPGAEPEGPACWSNDGVSPHYSVTSPRAASCATCPNNQFGSKINPNGSKVKACSDNKRLLVLAPDDIEGDFYAVNMPVMSLKEWNSYLRTLDAHNVPVGAVTTEISVHMDDGYPKLSFKFVNYLSAENFAKAQERRNDPVAIAFREGTTASTEAKPAAIAAPVASPAPAVAQAPVAQAAPSAPNVSPLKSARSKKTIIAPAPDAIPATASLAVSPDALDADLAKALEGF